jgi:hypothetical protein
MNLDQIIMDLENPNLTLQEIQAKHKVGIKTISQHLPDYDFKSRSRRMAAIRAARRNEFRDESTKLLKAAMRRLEKVSQDHHDNVLIHKIGKLLCKK